MKKSKLEEDLENLFNIPGLENLVGENHLKELAESIIIQQAMAETTLKYLARLEKKRTWYNRIFRTTRGIYYDMIDDSIANVERIRNGFKKYVNP